MPDITRFFLTRPQLELYKRKAMWGQDGFVSIIYDDKGIAKVSLWEWRDLGKKEQFHNQWDKVLTSKARPGSLLSCFQANINELL